MAESKLDVCWYQSYNCQDGINPAGIYTGRQASGFRRAAGTGMIWLMEEEEEIEQLLLVKEDLYSVEEYFWVLVSGTMTEEGSSQQLG